MPAKLTTEDFIERARQIHGDKYDYSESEYKTKDEKLTIICPVHGKFEQTPNNHWKGKGCPKCCKNHKLTQDEFIRKAKLVHDNKYDYSDTVFTKNAAMVTIRCPEHGCFTQEANSHLQGHGCPKCGKIGFSPDEKKRMNYAKRNQRRIATCRRLYGVDNVMQLASVRRKHSDTVMEHFGVDNPRKSQAVIDKARNTCVERYGAISYAKSEAGLLQIHKTLIEHYGVDNFMKSDAHYDKVDEMVAKAKATQMQRYGASHFTKSDSYKEHKSEYKRREIASKRKNGTFNASKPEDELYLRLISVFGEDDVIRQYSSDVYPFNCDFYIKSINTYIELNALWTHGGHFFNPDNEDDIKELKNRSELAKNSQYYRNSINVWTIDDIKKRDTAVANNLNYIVFWDNDLSDAKQWLKTWQ